MNRTFEMNGRAYRTDTRTLNLLRELVRAYRERGSRDSSAIQAVMVLGRETGIIEEIGSAGRNLS